jgi:ankyrin repeat protein
MTRSVIRLAVEALLILLVVLLSLWHWYGRLHRNCTFPVTKSYEVYFEWRGMLKGVHAVDLVTHREESSTNGNAVIWKESAEITSKIAASSRLDNADGSFMLTVVGCSEPYLVTWSDVNIPLLAKLLAAAESWNVGELRKSLATGVDVNARDLTNHTALLLAAIDPRKTIQERPELRAKITWEPDIEAVKLLLAAGADPNVKGNYGVTPLMLADESTVPILLAARADVNAHDDFSKTSLMYIAEKGGVRAVSLEVANGADVNARDKNGWTPLMYAASRGSVETVKTLLIAGSDTNAKDNAGKTALTIARERAKLEPQFRPAVTLLSSTGRNS